MGQKLRLHLCHKHERCCNALYGKRRTFLELCWRRRNAFYGKDRKGGDAGEYGSETARAERPFADEAVPDRGIVRITKSAL